MKETPVVSATITAAKSRGRPREFDMDLALDKAIRVFSERGYHASSITDLTQAMGLASGSVYKAFKDKRAIFIAAFDRYKAVRNDQLAQAIARGSTGREQLEQALGFYADSAHGELGVQGCLVVSGATELATFDEEIAQKVQLSLGNSERLLGYLIAKGKLDGSIDSTVDDAVVSTTILCLTQGMRVVGKTGRGKEEMQAVINIAMKMLD